MTSPIVDSHCHANSVRLPDTLPRLLEDAASVGVSDIVMAGVDPEGWATQSELSAAHKHLHPTYGVHPWRAAEWDDATLDAALSELQRRVDSERPVAVGETGLDGYQPRFRERLESQERSFREHLALAHHHNLPVVMHLVRAHEQALRVLAEVGLPPAGGMVHSFSGSAEVALRYVGLGAYVSFCGTLANPQSTKLRRAAAAVPLDRLLVETDAPDQTPHPHKGTANRPAFLPLVVEALATARGSDYEQIAAATSANARRLFRLPEA